MTSRNHSDLLGIVSSGLADNTSGLITAEVLRNISTDIVDTIFNVGGGDGGSGLLNVAADTGIGHLSIQTASGIRIVGGDSITTTLSDAGDGSGTITIDSAGSGTMSKLMLGVDRRWDGVTHYPVALTDSSGIMLKEGSNISLDFHNSDGSGIVVINSFPSTFKTVVASGDNSNAWNSHSSLVSDSSSDTLFFVGGTGIKLDTDANNDAIRISVSGEVIEGTGTMSRLKLGAQDGAGLQQLGDGSGLFFAAGANMTIALTNNDAGSGILTFAAVGPSGNAITTVSAGGDAGYTWTSQNDIVADGVADTLSLIAGTGVRLDTDATNDAIRFSVSGALPLATHPATSPASSSDNSTNTFIQDITLDAYGHITGIGTNEVGSGNFAPASASGTMSRLKVGASDGLNLQQLGDGSGLFFAAGDNMTITLTNNDAGSGIITFASATVEEASGNAFTTISTDYDTGYTWAHKNDIVAEADADTLTLVAGTGIRIDTDNSNDAIRLAVSGNLPHVTEVGTITAGTWDATTIALDKGGTGATSFGPSEIIFKSASSDVLESSPRMKFNGEVLAISHTSGPSLTLENTNDDANAGILKFNKDGDSPSNNDTIGTIEFSSEDDANNGTTYGKIVGTIVDVSADSEEGAIDFYVSETDGTLTKGMSITGIDSDGDITVDISTHDGSAGGLKLGGTLVTATAAELNYVDGVTSNIQTQIDAISGSGTMSKFHVGSTTQVDPTQISIGDGSGLFFAAGSNMTITTTNTDGSGVITFAADSSGGSARSVSGDTDDAIITWKTSDNTFVAESNLTYDGTTLKVAGLQGNNPGVPFIESDGIIYGSGIAAGPSGLRIAGVAVTSTATELNYVDGVTSAIQTQLDTKGSGTMSRLKVGASDGLPQLQQLGDGSGLFFAAGSNMTVTLTNNDAGSGILTFASDVSTNNPTFTGNITIGSAEISETELEILDGATLTTTELNYVDGVTSAIQTQLDAKGSGTMSRLKIGASDGLPQLQQLGDGSGIFFAAGDNVSVTLTNSDAGSGIVTIASAHPSISAASTSDNGGNTFIQDITLDGNGHVTGIGTNTIPSGNYHPVIDASNRLDASLIGANGNVSNTEYGYLASVSSDIQTQLDAKGSGTMSRFKVGASDGLPQLQQLGDGSGLFFAAGDNVSVTLTNSDAGSGIVTIASAHPSISAASTSDNGGNTFIQDITLDGNGHVTGIGTNTIPSGNYATTASPTFTGVVTTPRLVVTALAGNTGGVPHIDSDGIIYGSGISAGPSGLRINGTAVTATAAELNIMDGGATVTTPTVAGADAFVMNDGGTMAQVDIDNVDTYLSATTKTLTNKTLTSPTITSPTITGTTNLASGVLIGVPSTESSDGYSLEVAGQIRASGVVVAPITASDAATVTFDLKQSNFHMLTLARASTTLVFADAKPGQRFLTRLTQDSTGSRAVVWPGGISWARAAGVGTPPPLSTTAAHSTMYGFVCTSGVGATMYYDGFIIGSGIQGTST